MIYRPEIDGLRAIAVLPVILFHAGIPYFSGGFVGVDVFFVISGYLITTIILKKLAEGSFSFLDFYERRIRRIFPALFTVLLTCIPFAWATMTPEQYERFSKNLISVVFFFSNIRLWKEQDYFSPSAEENPLLHTWSLSLEEQFYFLFPLLMFFIWQLGKCSCFFVISALSIISFVFMLHIYQEDSAGAFYLLPARAWELGLGCLTAFICWRYTVKNYRFLATAGVALIVLSVFTFDQSTTFPSFYTLTPTIGTVLFLTFSNRESIASRLLSTRTLVTIGLISYSAYLWHQPIFAFLRIMVPEHPGTFHMLLLSALTLALAFLSWKYVEIPFRKQHQTTYRGAFLTSAAVALLITSAGIHGDITEGVPNRFKLTERQQQYLDTAAPSPKRAECHADEQNPIPAEEACVYNAPNKAKIAVLGDSHAVELAYMLGQSFNSEGVGVRHFSFSGCTPTLPSEHSSSPCERWNARSLRFIQQSEDIDYVVISYRLAAILSGDHSAGYPRVPAAPSKQHISHITGGLYSIFDILNAADKNIIFIEQAPELPDDIAEIIYKSGDTGISMEGVSREWWNKRYQLSEKIVSTYPGEIEVVSPKRLFCNVLRCFSGSDGLSYYFDDDHISLSGAEIVIQAIMESTELSNVKNIN
jgi:peptidoglycan/LPS O-acetylase OafA/YrhL